MRGSAVGAVLVVVGLAACAGEDATPKDAKAKPETPPPLDVKITGTDLNATAPGMLIAPKKFTLFGKVTGGTRAARRRATVAVYASPYPHRRWRRVARKRGGDEVIGFRLGPNRNTRYELRLAGEPGARSRRIPIYVDLRGRIDGTLPAVGVVDASWRVETKRRLEPARGVVHFYVWPDKSKPLRHIGTARPRSDGPNGVIASARIEDPLVGDRVLLFACVRGLLAKGQGHPYGSDPACGAPTIRATPERVGRE